MYFRYWLRYFLLLLASGLVIAFGSVPLQAQSPYVYAYLRFDKKEGSTDFITLDPTSLTLDSRIYPTTEGWAYRTVHMPNIPSPDGAWVLSYLLANDGSRLRSQIFSPSSGEVHQISEGYVLYLGTAAWSLDSHRVAVIMGQLSQDTEVIIYDVAKDEVVNLSNDNFDQQAGVVWSPDAHYLATFARPCPYDQACPIHLQLFDIGARALVAEIELSTLPFFGDFACDLMFSPDNRYVSFGGNCGLKGGAWFDFHSEMYLWDWANEQDLRQITNTFTGTTATNYFRARYQQHWLDSDTLLIGANDRIKDAPENRQLFTYHPSEDTTTALSTTIGADFALNPVTNAIAGGTAAYFDFEREANAGRPTAMSLSALSLSAENQAANLTTHVAAPVSVPDACSMTWSPDGATLAIVTSTTNCDLFPDSVIFVDGKTGTSQTYMFEREDGDTSTYIIPIGWVKR